MNQLSVLTFNFNGLPVITTNYRRRLEVLRRELTRIKPDIVCIQEIWMGRSKNAVINSLRAAGYKGFSAPRPDVRFCGHLTCTKPPLEELGMISGKPFFRLSDFSFIEMPGFKGVFLVKMNFGDFSVCVFNVHLVADWNIGFRSGSGKDTFGRNNVINLSESINNLKNEKIIVAGDLNFSHEAFLHNEFVKLSGIRNIVPKNIQNNLKPLFKFPYPTSEGRVDHVFIKNFPKRTAITTQVLWVKKVGGVQLSDHPALLITLKW